MDKPRVTPRDFFVWAGAMVALYASVFSFISLIFDYINYAYPDALQYMPVDPYTGGVAYEMASLIVLFPTFIILMWLVRRDIARDSNRGKVWVRRWALVLTLFLAGAAMAGDLITLIMYFLQGELTIRFVLKVALVLLVAAAIFMHFLADIWGYWDQYPGRARSVGWASAVLVLASIVAGFFIIGTPMQARLYRFDEQKVSDLQSIQSQVVSYWQAKQTMPSALSDLNDSISGFAVPVDPQDNSSYEYRVTGTHNFELCAMFNAESRDNSMQTIPVRPAGAKADSWFHAAGHVCFDRTIDPELYPPLSKTQNR